MKTIHVVIVASISTLLFISFASPVFADRSWNKKIEPAKFRFRVLSKFNNEAVFDRETGLVWEIEPNKEGPREWSSPFIGAVDNCFSKTVGNRKGWRLATVAELSSLVDSTQTNPALPLGHPFINVLVNPDQFGNNSFWTATSESSPFSPSAVNRAYTVGFRSGSTGVSAKGNLLGVWCVRGGQGHDGLVGH